MRMLTTDGHSIATSLHVVACCVPVKHAAADPPVTRNRSENCGFAAAGEHGTPRESG